MKSLLFNSNNEKTENYIKDYNNKQREKLTINKEELPAWKG